MVATCVSPSGATSPTAEATPSLLASPTSVSEKMRHRQQAAMLDEWLSLHGDNLYPCRAEKEKLAKHVCATYTQVNRWFANRRRQQTKRRRASVTSTSPRLAASSDHSDHSEHSLVTCSQLENFSHDPARGRIPLEDHMVVNGVDRESVNSDILKPEVLRHASPEMSNNCQQVPDAFRQLTSPDSQRICETTPDAKLMGLSAGCAATPSPFSSFTEASAAAALTAAAAQTANPFLLAAAIGLHQNPNGALAWLPTLLPFFQQLQAQAQQAAFAEQVLAVQQAVAAARQQMEVLQPAENETKQWNVPQVSSAPETCSPLMIPSEESYSSLSETSELSPMRSELISPFKEPSLQHTEEHCFIGTLKERRTDLSEKESIAVAVLAGMASGYQP